MNDAEFNKLWQSARGQLKTELDYTKLTLAEKTSILLSRIFVVAITILVGMSIVLFLALSLAQLLASATGCTALAYLIVALILVVIVLVIYAFKKQWIVDPVARFVSKLFLSPDDK